jgi:hypothetical protein
MADQATAMVAVVRAPIAALAIVRIVVVDSVTGQLSKIAVRVWVIRHSVRSATPWSTRNWP